MATAAQIEANRRNAQKSTGPKTDEGKDRSRRNALKHGMAARELLPEQERQAAEDRSAQWQSSLRPWTAFEEHLVDRIAAESVRVERCAAEERAVRALAARRAELCWDDDRALDAEVLGGRIARKPAEVKALLESTPHGCAWLAARWGELIRVLESAGTWDDARRDRAHDLLGLPEDRRVAPGPLDLPPSGLLDLARREAERLEARAERMAELDDAERDLAECGMGPEVEKAVRRIRRYERSCLRRIEWACDQLKKHRNGSYPHPRRPSQGDDFGGATAEMAARSSSYPTSRPPAPAGPPRASGPDRTEPIDPARTNPIAAAPPTQIAASPDVRLPMRPSLASALAPAAGNRRDRRAARKAG